MDPFTLAWIILMGLSGLILGLFGLIRGSITLSARTGTKAALYPGSSLGFYLLCISFLFSGLALISVSLYLYV